MQAKELRRQNHKYALKAMINANPEQPVRFTVGYLKGLEAANNYNNNPEKLPTSPKFWFLDSMFANGFRSAFTMYTGNIARNEVNRIFHDMYMLEKCLDI